MIRVAISGCGSITKFRHAPEYNENPNVEIAGFYDYVAERAELFASIYGGKAYKTYEELVNDCDVDAVSICTANRFHTEQSVIALNKNKHVLCEKPMSQSVEEAREIVAAVKTSGKLFMVGHNQRLAPAHIKAKEIIKSGALGKILTFKTCFGHAGPESWGVVKDASTWFFNPSLTSMGSLGDLGVHKIDLMRWLLNDEFSEVYAQAVTLDKKGPDGNLINIDDNVICTLKTMNGAIGTLTTSWTYYGDEDNSTQLYGTKGILKIYSNPDFPLELTTADGSKVFYKVGKIATNDDQVKSGIIDLFVDCLLQERKPPINEIDGLRSIEIVDAIQKSAREGQTIKIPFAL
jgi:predicted dehydrogenase